MKETRLDKAISDVGYILDGLVLLRKIMETGDCNVCANKDCEYIPKPGQMVRYNCPFYKSEEDACIEELDVAEEEVDSNPTKPDITDYVKLLDSLPVERKKALNILYDLWFKKAFGVDPKLFKKEEVTIMKEKTGQWIKDYVNDFGYYKCSLCSCSAPFIEEKGDKVLWKLSNYCSGCGAKMNNAQEEAAETAIN